MADELEVRDGIRAALDARRNFLVEAGAGAGKTTALVEALLYLLDTRRQTLEQAGKKIACITYTNVAKHQIKQRIAEDPLVYVGTIHEFLWSLIQGHQRELLDALIEYNRGLPRPQDMAELASGLRIEYHDRGRRFADGKISHDEVLALASTLIGSHPKLARIIAHRYPVIFVDEYQDTFRTTITLLLEHIATAVGSTSTVGFFGDSMQKIYNTGVGALQRDDVVTLTMHGNHRCAKPIVEVLNKIRPELIQQPDADKTDGEVRLFLKLPGADDQNPVHRARVALDACGWPATGVKFLSLTHRSIATAHGYPNLLQLYSKRGSNGRDDLLEGTEPYAQFMKDIEELCAAYEAQEYAHLTALLGTSPLTIRKHTDKARINGVLQEITSIRSTGTVGDVLDAVTRTKLITPPGRVRSIERTLGAEGLDERAQKDAEFAAHLRGIDYREVVRLTQYRNELTPFSTQHGVKGDQFENVVVMIDDSAWNQFNVDRMLTGDDHLTERVSRSRNLFYVCCSRAIRRLAVVFVTPLSPGSEAVARQWFSGGAVHD
ncbi:UvrD-helicase domain-containing protein [Streptomyces decoyicus]|uniref:UvrD-helicase domain-containing protein n=1 Tax=Streptomyces decoyicus TaxID=249567 RepID=UPI0036649797